MDLPFCRTIRWNGYVMCNQELCFFFCVQLPYKSIMFYAFQSSLGIQVLPFSPVSMCDVHVVSRLVSPWNRHVDYLPGRLLMKMTRNLLWGVEVSPSFVISLCGPSPCLLQSPAFRGSSRIFFLRFIFLVECHYYFTARCFPVELLLESIRPCSSIV